MIGFLSPHFRIVRISRMRNVSAGTTRTRICDGTNIVDRISLRGRAVRSAARPCCGIGPTEVDVIVTAVTQASLAAKACHQDNPDRHCDRRPTRSGSGLIENLARPGRQYHRAHFLRRSEVVGKSVGFAHRAVIPGIVRVAALRNPSNVVFQTKMLKEAEMAAAALRFSSKSFGRAGR